jgi:hypothetical protein
VRVAALVRDVVDIVVDMSLGEVKWMRCVADVAGDGEDAGACTSLMELIHSNGHL